MRFPAGSRVIGHRGEPDRFPDNSLAGVMSGLATARAVEVDVRMTADGRLVLAHDPWVGGHLLAESTWAEIADVDIGSGHRPCLLDEAMGVPGRFDLEVKNLPGQPDFDPSGRVALLAAARARAADLVSSFFWPDMDLVARRAGDVTTGLLVAEGGSVEDAVTHATAGGHPVVVIHHTLLGDRSDVEQVTGSGLRVVAWTVNEPARAVSLIDWGVSAVVTDRPSTLSAVLAGADPI